MQWPAPKDCGTFLRYILTFLFFNFISIEEIFANKMKWSDRQTMNSSEYGELSCCWSSRPTCNQNKEMIRFSTATKYFFPLLFLDLSRLVLLCVYSWWRRKKTASEDWLSRIIKKNHSKWARNFFFDSSLLTTTQCVFGWG